MDSLSLQDLGRMQEIAGVLMRHGLGEAVRRLGMADALERAGHVLKRENAAELARLTPPEQVRRAFEELGPTFVKLGQVLSVRPDILPEDVLREFETLQDKVPAMPFSDVKSLVEQETGHPMDEVFETFDEAPLGSASIAPSASSSCASEFARWAKRARQTICAKAVWTSALSRSLWPGTRTWSIRRRVAFRDQVCGGTPAAADLMTAPVISPTVRGPRRKPFSRRRWRPRARSRKRPR